MKRLLLSAIAFGFAAGVCAQDRAPATDTIAPVQAPPEMDSPAAVPAPPPVAPTAPPANLPSNAAAPTTAPAPQDASTIPLGNSDEEAKAAAAAEARAIAERTRALMAPTTAPRQSPKPLESPGLPPDVQKAAEATELPVVTVRQQGNETIKEYRKHGQLYFVGVVSNEGPTRYYVDNPTDVPLDMRRLSAPSGVVQPVYYRLYEWK